MAYNAKKAAQTIAYFAIKNGRLPLDVLKAVKLVYLADRKSLARFGFPIQDELRVSMPHGPVNSETYSSINGERDLVQSGWAEFLQDRENHTLALTRQDIAESDLDELSEADVSVLDDVWAEFGHMSKYALRDWTHERKNIPEWEDPKGSSLSIPLERILGYLNVPNSEQQAQLTKEFGRIDDLFRSLR